MIPCAGIVSSPSGLMMNICAVFLVLSPLIVEASRPNIVFVVADDLGWNDVGWHNPSVKTPNLTAFARAGIILNRSYVSPTCTPSRAAFMTGLYSHRTGLQHGPLGDLEPAGLPINLPLVAERLKEAGYSTHLVGKWHLGFCNDAFLPIKRGFHTFYGYLTGLKTYFTHLSYTLTEPKVTGFDFRDQEKPALDQVGTFSVHSYSRRVSQIISEQNGKKPFFLYYSLQTVHTPLQVPESYMDGLENVTDPYRRKYLGLVSAMDEAFGRLIEDLKRKDILKKTLIVFTSDNGGVLGTGGASNDPLQGAKDTLWDGGIRVPGFIYSETLGRSRYTEEGLVHATDWAATFLDLAGAPVKSFHLDGISQARTLLKGKGSSRTELVANLDERERNGAYIESPYKLIWGSPTYSRNWTEATLMAVDKVMLFNIVEDPSETQDIHLQHPAITSRLLLKLLSHQSEIVPSGDGHNDAAGSPRYWKGLWAPGWCNYTTTQNTTATTTVAPRDEL